VLLQLEVDVVRSEQRHQLLHVRAGVALAIFEQALTEARGQAAGERDHALGVAVQQCEVDRWLAALEALEEPRRRKLDEVAVTVIIGSQQREVVALSPLSRGG